MNQIKFINVAASKGVWKQILPSGTGYYILFHRWLSNGSLAREAHPMHHSFFRLGTDNKKLVLKKYKTKNNSILYSAEREKGVTENKRKILSHVPRHTRIQEKGEKKERYSKGETKGDVVLYS